MQTRRLIELEAKKDANECAKQIIVSVLTQETNKIAQLIGQEKDKISKQMELSGKSISNEVIKNQD
jgi:hypothetical protein